MKPTLLMVSRSTPLHPEAGGMEEISWQLAHDLSSSWNVRILTTAIPDSGRVVVRDGITVHTVSCGQPGRYGIAWWALSACHPLARDADVIVSVSAGATTMTWRRRPVFVFQAHGTALAEAAATWRGRSGKWLLKAARSLWWAGIDSLMYRRMDVVVAASEQVRDGLLGKFYRRAWLHTPLVVIPNGVPVRPVAFRASSARGEAVVVLTVSRLTRQKGVDRCIAALAQAPPQTRLVVVGDGDELPALKAQARRLGVADRVHFAGRLARDNIDSAWEMADVFVFPVRNASREGLPIAVLEALAAGLRVLVPAESRWPDDLRDVVDLVAMDDAVALGLRFTTGTALPRESLLPPRYTGRCMSEKYTALLRELAHQGGLTRSFLES